MDTPNSLAHRAVHRNPNPPSTVQSLTGNAAILGSPGHVADRAQKLVLGVKPEEERLLNARFGSKGVVPGDDDDDDTNDMTGIEELHLKVCLDLVMEGALHRSQAPEGYSF